MTPGDIWKGAKEPLVGSVVVPESVYGVAGVEVPI